MKTKSNISVSEPPSKKQRRNWNEGLLEAFENPDLKVFEDNEVVAIKDMYPKAMFHYLICSKENIPSVKFIKVEHLSLLKHMHEVAESIGKKYEGVEFITGYHSVPSMVRLHLHVISTDFDSPHLKTKKHWNSFNTDFFISDSELIKELEENENLSLKSESEFVSLLKKDLKCHKCEYNPKHMPDLKYHLKTHVKN